MYESKCHKTKLENYIKMFVFAHIKQKEERKLIFSII